MVVLLLLVMWLAASRDERVELAKHVTPLTILAIVPNSFVFTIMYASDVKVFTRLFIVPK